jgi:two-component system chemotaxis response regulator CheY
VRILLVEDMEVTRNIYKNILDTFGQVDIACDGIEAMNMFVSSMNRNKMYDIVFLDVIMPKSSGFHVLERIRKYENLKRIENKTKIIIISSLNSDKDIDAAIKLGADKVMVKPIDKKAIEDYFKEINLIKKED